MQINISEVRTTGPEKRWAPAASVGLQMPPVFQKLLGSRFLSMPVPESQVTAGAGMGMGQGTARWEGRDVA